jgi:cyclohexadienyl dehydratase
MNKIFAGAFCLLMLGVFSTATSAQNNPEPEVSRLYELIAHRLSFMEDVAAWKWQNDKPVEDKAREAIVLTAAAQQSEQYGLDGSSTTSFFIAQMEAAKLIQRQQFEGWAARSPDEVQPPISAPDLSTELRPAITQAGNDILAQISLTLPYLQDIDADALGRVIALPPAHLAAVVAGLKQIRYHDTAQSTLWPTILQQGRLRVGTTGDYAPFSTSTVEGNRTGIDIDLAQSLAAFLGVQLVFTQTSWPTLLDDLTAGKYDIAMSGISIKPFRQKIGHMSEPYQTGGKTPIIRCADQDKLNSLDAIDEPGIRVIVNPGGTNERYTMTNIKEAPIRVFDNNSEIFDEIVAGRADVMITDAIEVIYRSGRHPSLCPALPGETLTVSQKGFLMPQDDVFLLHVNRWLHGIQEDGTLQAIFDKHLKPSVSSTAN